MWPRLHISASWTDRAEGRLKYRLIKAWIPAPGQPTSTRTLAEGTVVVNTHVEDERMVLGELLYALSVEVSTVERRES